MIEAYTLEELGNEIRAGAARIGLTSIRKTHAHTKLKGGQPVISSIFKGEGHVPIGKYMELVSLLDLDISYRLYRKAK